MVYENLSGCEFDTSFMLPYVNYLERKFDIVIHFRINEFDPKPRVPRGSAGRPLIPDVSVTVQLNGVNNKPNIIIAHELVHVWQMCEDRINRTSVVAATDEFDKYRKSIHEVEANVIAAVLNGLDPSRYLYISFGLQFTNEEIIKFLTGYTPPRMLRYLKKKML